MEAVDKAPVLLISSYVMPNDQTLTDTGDTLGAVNTPDLTPALKPTRRAIKDTAQARRLIDNLVQSSRERNQKNARIMAKYNSEKPYTQSELEASGLGWKSNFTTKPLSRLIDKVAPRFVKAVEAVKYLTNSSLPEDVQGNPVKTEKFRSEITKTIRARPGWSNLISEIAQENGLFGFTDVSWLDEFHWFPKHFRQDQFYVPTGTGHLADAAQIVILRDTFLMHELFALIEDKSAAEAAGWNIQHTVDAINKAMPEDRRSKQTDWERIYEDLIRECNTASSHENGARVINVWHALATEITGKVTHYIILDNGSSAYSPKSMDYDETDNPAELFVREDQFEKMCDACTFFSFQHGNGKIHGSKGIGREIYSMAAMLDRARNEVVDRLNLAGKLIIQAGDKDLKKFKMSVVGSALLIGEGYTISERKIDPAVEPFLELDKFLTSLLDEISGAVTPKALEGERVTAAAVNLLAGREEEGRDNIIGRFMSQFANLISTMQKRLCDPHTSEDDAKAMQKRILEIMTPEEMQELADQPVAETVKDFTEQERQQIVLIAQEGRGNPLYNQRELEKRKISALISDEFADAVLLPDNDPTETAEQTRLQQLELLIIAGQGAQVPISPRDGHVTHLQVLLPAMEAAATQAVQDPKADDVLEAMLQHAEGHLAAAKQAATPPEQLAQIEPVITKLRAAMAQLTAHRQQLEQLGATENPPPSGPGAQLGGAPTAPTAAPPPPSPI